MRMWLRDAILETIEAVMSLEHALMERASASVNIIMPGFTHQHAQPITLGHHLMAHFYRLQRDTERFLDCYRRTNISPLGSAALAGTTYNIDRSYTARLLGSRPPVPTPSMEPVTETLWPSIFSPPPYVPST